MVTQHLAKPIQTDDGPVSDVVSEVTWTADSPAAQIKPGAFGKFEIIVGFAPIDRQPDHLQVDPDLLQR